MAAKSNFETTMNIKGILNLKCYYGYLGHLEQILQTAIVFSLLEMTKRFATFFSGYDMLWNAVVFQYSVLILY